MKKKILVLQFRTDESLKHERECIIKMGDLKKSDLHFLNVLNLKTKLPKVKNLAKYKGRTLFEMNGDIKFPKITNNNYSFTLSGHRYFWFKLKK